MINRNLAPIVNLPKHLNFEATQKVLLSNGFPLYVVNGSSQNIFQLSIVFKAGRFFESKRMLAGLSASMILKGTKKKSAFEIAESFDFYGAAVKFNANMYSAELSLYCLTEQLPVLLPLLVEVLEEASFPEKELKKVISKTKQKLAVQWEKNSYSATQHFNQAIFGVEHPFGYFSQTEHLNLIQQNDLQEHYQHFKLKKDAFCVVAGKIGPREIDLINTYIGSLAVFEPTKKEFGYQASLETNIHVSSKNNIQAAIRLGMPTINIQHPDFEDLQILNTVLGGYFGSRLMTNIREDKGFTYGIYSFINPIMDTSYFCISTEVGAAYKNATLKEIEFEINRLKNELISEDELAMVKNYMIGQLMKSIDGPLNIMSTLKNFLIFDLEINEINKQLASLHQITPARLQNLAVQYFDFEKMHKVVVA